MSMRPWDEDGQQLADAIGARAGVRPLVLAVPRRGVALAERVARALTAPMDVLVAGRVHAPGGPAVAAIAEGGAMVVDDDALTGLHLTIGDLDPVVDERQRELEAFARRLRGGRAVAALAGRTVVIVDDALTTGLTMRAAVAAALAARASEVIVAAPLCSTEARRALAAGGHDVAALAIVPAAEIGERQARRGGPRPPTDREIQQMIDRSVRCVWPGPSA